MVDRLKQEEGFTLFQTLVTVVFITLIGTGIIFIGFQISRQISVTEHINQVKDEKVFVSQEAKLTLDQGFNELFDYEVLKMQPLGKNDNTLKKLVGNYVRDNQVLNEEDFGNQKGGHFVNTIESFTIEPMTGYSAGEDIEQGWVSGGNQNTYAYRVTLPIKSEITEQNGNIQTIWSDYVYEIQWESRDAGELTYEADIWGQMYYQVNRPGGIQYLSADTVMRKMAQIYHLQDVTPSYLESFPDKAFSERMLNGLYGVKNQYVSDMSDQGKIFDKQVGQLEFEGSLLLDNGFSLKGNSGQSLITTKNLLSLSNETTNTKQLSDSRLENVSLDARTGLYLGLASDGDRRMTIDNSKNHTIKTTNMVINHTINPSNPNVGTFITSGVIDIKATDYDVTNFKEYKSHSTTQNIQQKDWEQYQSGNFIISQSKVVLAPNGRSDLVQINVANNFMLTNASMDNGLDENTFSYFVDSDYKTIRPPSQLILSGRETSLVVDGYSFIDAPKRNPRPLIGEGESVKSDYVLSQGLNKIELKDNSQMILGFTGIEAFDFSSEKDTIFSMKILPNLALFNSDFLEKGFHHDKIQGKVILETAQEQDKVKMIDLLEEKSIPYEVVKGVDATFKNINNNVVTIYDNPSQSSKGDYAFITREFSYMTNVALKENVKQKGE